MKKQRCKQILNRATVWEVVEPLVFAGDVVEEVVFPVAIVKLEVYFEMYGLPVTQLFMLPHSRFRTQPPDGHFVP